MSLVSSSIPNLINGVSQQPHQLRLPSQADEQINAHSSVVDGLRKRPPSRFEFKVGEGVFANRRVFCHQIDRDVSEKYTVLISNKEVKVFNLLTKQEVTVLNQGAAKAYLDCENPSKDLRAITVADYTFILNRTKIAKSLDDVIPQYRPEAIIWVKQGAYGSKYEVTIDNVTVAFLTPARAATSQEWTDGYRWEDQTTGEVVTGPTTYTPTPPRPLPKNLTQQHAATDYIARNLYDLLSQNPTLSTKFTFTRAGSLIRVRSIGNTTNQGTVYPNFSVSVRDSQGDTVLKAFKDRVQNFSDLPIRCFGDFRIKVMGDGSTEFDDYYVRFDGNTSGGIWVEDINDLQRYKLDSTTLPHALIRQADGTFSFEAIEWEPRKAGDAKSNPIPSFIGKRIRDLFFYRDRLGFVAQENVVMSRYGDYFNFFKASATQILDTDPIDVAVSHVKVSDINHAVAYNGTLLLFAQETQFQINKPDLLTPKTVAFDQTTEFACTPSAKPVGAGANVYFAYDRGGYGAIREYYVDEDSTSKDANDVTSHIPRYILGDIDQMAVSQTENILVCLSSKAPRTLYAYNYYWNGEEKIQSSWSKWVFDAGADILSVQFVGSTLWMTVYRNDYITMESIDLSPGAIDEGLNHLIHLDRRFDEGSATVAYNASTDETVITPPYPAYDDLVIIAKEGNPVTSMVPGRGLFTGYVEGERINYRINAFGQIVVPYRLTKFWIGRPYEMRYRFSTLYLRNRDNQAVTDGRLQLRKLVLSFVDSGYFRVEVKPVGRETFTYLMTAKQIGSSTTKVGKNRILSGGFNVPVMSQNVKVTIEIVNDNVMPSTFLNGEWEGFYVQRAARL